jgi:hypothetical protein
MSDGKVSAALYVVLGLAPIVAPTTPYGMWQWMERGVGYFWRFPRARLFSEPARLASSVTAPRYRQSGRPGSGSHHGKGP